MKKIFISNFSNRINDFLKQKVSLGYDYSYGYFKLKEFAEFAAENYPTESFLTKKLALAFAARKENEGQKTRNTRIIALRQFALYLLSLGEDAYVIPTDFLRKEPQMTPHIYSTSEIAVIWAELDKMKPSENSPAKHLVIPAMFRMIYSCGLRPSEAIKLRVEDVDLSIGILNISESKGHKSRTVSMAEDLIAYCRNYNKQIDILLPKRTVFFPNKNGTKYCYQSVWQIFKKTLANVGMLHTREGRPRICDFRHSFATHRLYLWMKEGKDLNAMLPYLSAYMGHSSPSVSFYYIHLVPGLMESMSGKNYTGFQKLLPEVPLL